MILKKIVIFLVLLGSCFLHLRSASVIGKVKNHKNTPVPVPQLEFQNSLQKMHFEWPEYQKRRNAD